MACETFDGREGGEKNSVIEMFRKPWNALIKNSTWWQTSH